MQIQVNTDKHIDGHAMAAQRVEDTLTAELSHYSAHITRLEVHLSDANSAKSGLHDKHCLLEARLEGQTPLIVTHDAADIDQAVSGAAEKLVHAIAHHLGKLEAH